MNEEFREQPDLFFHSGNGEAHARKSDPDTSHEAAKEMRGEKANALEALVVATLRQHPNGLTTHGISDITGVQRVSISPRIRPLVRKGLVVDSGFKESAKMGKPCIVWKACPLLPNG